MIFDTIKEGIIEILDECLVIFCTETLAIVGTHTLTF